MNNKGVLLVDEDSYRAEKLVFIVQFGGYETRIFGSCQSALNWAKYGCSEGEALCLLFNNPGNFDRAEQIVADWRAAGMTLPVVLVQRGKGSWNHLLTIGEKDHFVVCEPESVMQTLDILMEITVNNRINAGEGAAKRAGCRGSGA